jgi:signal transduction histidine kinase
MEQRILLVVDGSAEDRATAISQIRRDLNFSYQITEAATLAAALAAVSRARPDCVVLDQKLPDGSGLDFLLAVSDPLGHPPFPVIILASAGDLESAVAMMKAGARDYLVKSNTNTNTNTSTSSIRLAVNNAIYKDHVERRLEEQRQELKLLYNETSVSNDALRAANASKDDFLAMLSHELRTPLTPVLSLVSSTINDKNLSADLKEIFSVIQRNVELEARLIDDLLDLTQIASGRLKIEKSPVDIHRCIEAALDVCHEGFAEKRIIIRADLAATSTVVMGEFARLNQVFWNLLKNAVKYTRPHGHVSITTTNDQGNIVVEIQDDGQGIEPERLASVFGTFHPIKPHPTDTGIGLGLAIARAIVEGHEGEICAESEGRDHGAVFRIRLPVVQAEPGTSDHEAPPATNTALHGKSILVVEDHDDTRRALSRALQRKGFDVTAAGSVAAALRVFSSSAPDLVICDIGLSDGTGWELMERLHQRGPVRAIAVSGYGMDHDVNKSRKAGFIQHLTKPINMSNLEKTIAATLLDAPAPNDSKEPPATKTISLIELEEWQDSNRSYALIDVLPNSQSQDRRLLEKQSRVFQERISTFGVRKDEPIVLYCFTGPQSAYYGSQHGTQQ